MAAEARASESLTGRSAHERLSRASAMFVGSGGVFYGLILTPDILTQRVMVPAWWTPVAVLTVFGSAIAILVVAARGSMPQIGTAVDTFAAAFLVAEASWLILHAGATLSPEHGMWLAAFPGLAALAGAIVWRPATVFAYLLITNVLGQYASYLARIDHGNNPLILEIAGSTVFCSLFAAAGMGIVRSGRILDDTAATVEVGAAQIAATEAQAAERRRFDALIHDGVMATFLSASRTPNSTALADQARATIRQLNRLRSDETAAGAYTAEAVVAQVRAAVAEIDDLIPVIVVPDPDWDELTIPADAARACCAGVIEALRNVQRHTDGSASEVRMTMAFSGFRVVVADDGPGFDPTSVPSRRLGLRVSIRGRFAELPGGWATVDSAPGRGTVVTMGWDAT